MVFENIPNEYPYNKKPDGTSIYPIRLAESASQPVCPD